jgi:hypothetical protein
LTDEERQEEDKKEKRKLQAEKRKRRTEAEKAAELEQARKERERKEKREAKAAAEAMDMLSARFTDDELRCLGKLLEASNVYGWLTRLVSGDRRSLYPEALENALAPWRGRFAQPEKGQPPKRADAPATLDLVAAVIEPERVSRDLSDYATAAELEEIATDLDDERLRLAGEGRVDDAERFDLALQSVVSRRLPDPDLRVTHPILERIWSDVEGAWQRVEARRAMEGSAA